MTPGAAAESKAAASGGATLGDADRSETSARSTGRVADDERPTRADLDLDDEVESILARLRHDGGRATTGRRAIVRALLSDDDHHVTPEALTAKVQTRHPHVHLSTVYRTLDALAAVGVLDRIALGTGRSVYHVNEHRRQHHHLVCVSCGSVVEVPSGLVAPLAAEIEHRFGYTLDSHGMVIRGRCRACRGDRPA